MKMGVRKPSVKKSIKAKTTGKIKRQVKSAVNPMYGKKGMGMINDPQKAMYNKVYNKTTVSVSDLLDNESLSDNDEFVFPEDNSFGNSPKAYRICGKILKVISYIAAVFAILGLISGVMIVFGFFLVVFLIFFGLGKLFIKIGTEENQ